MENKNRYREISHRLEHNDAKRQHPQREGLIFTPG